jgi:cytochrome P450
MTEPVDLVTPEFVADPRGRYARLREQAPVVRVSLPGLATPVWLVTRYDEVKAALRDPRFVRDHRNVPGSEGASIIDQKVAAFGFPPEYRDYLLNLVNADGKDHSRLRTLVSSMFTPRRIHERRPQVERIVDDLLDAVVGAESVDLISAFSLPLANTSICEIIGVDPADRPRVREWMYGFTSGDVETLVSCLRSTVEYTRELIGRRRSAPGDDLISALTLAEAGAGDRLTEAEIISTVLMLITTGHYPPAQFLALATLALLDHPDQLALLRGRPELIPRAVHELLRFTTLLQSVEPFYAAEDVEFGGATIRRGDAVTGCLFAANHDPRAFPDPDRLDISRDPGRGETHLAFASGPHYCLGAALGRLQAEVAFDRLFVRHDLSLAVPRHEVEFVETPGVVERSLHRLPVRVNPVPMEGTS